MGAYRNHRLTGRRGLRRGRSRRRVEALAEHRREQPRRATGDEAGRRVHQPRHPPTTTTTTLRGTRPPPPPPRGSPRRRGGGRGRWAFVGVAAARDAGRRRIFPDASVRARLHPPAEAEAVSRRGAARRRGSEREREEARGAEREAGWRGERERRGGRLGLSRLARRPVYLAALPFWC